MRYRKIKSLPYLGNSERCLVQRAKCAKYILEQMDSDLIFVSVD